MATLTEMFPDRLAVCLGSGEASNEHITGDRWPPKPERNARLRESADVIRALLRGEEVTHDGLVRVDRPRLWSRLATVIQSREALEWVVATFREGGGDGKPMLLQAHVSWAPNRRRRADRVGLEVQSPRGAGAADRRRPGP